MTNEKLKIQLELWQQVDDRVKKIKKRLGNKKLMLEEVKGMYSNEGVEVEDWDTEDEGLDEEEILNNE
ncbi:hypothetical protein PM082_002158 [Marasmius tenuissimus]|nr:hypothetical protein PM082_002158 [Marasmius tenuissimus]